ncbi:MAG: cation:proton antiporter [Bacteroidetes bacterium]|nr:cation:proton antiporter [Bacteroidota bacterium]MBS1568075.1 cation:proton antiporter [Bacteroidota bacterium]MBS1939893.1 cation:proton antiporter [Bacteroidota bacterium]
MEHLPDLIADLGLILSVAAATTLISKKLKQPLVLGYIVAGMLVGPHVTLLPTVLDEESINIWSQLGVVFLLFALGLEFSFKKVVKVGGTSGITALTTVTFMLLVGYFTGQALGWTTMDSLFLGGLISMSSTTIIARALDELGLKTQTFASVVVGVLVIEDIVAVLLLVLLSSLAVSNHFSGGAMLWELGKLGFFLILWFAAGVFLIPSLLARTRKLMNDETLLIVAVALCLTMVVLAVNAGFSAALGAFIMGALLAETVQAERIEHLVTPVKDLFGAIFFISVGMLLDPAMLVQHWASVLLLSAVVVIGQPLSSFAGALMAGLPLKRAVRVAMSLSQIGEFSFIIATLGLTLEVTSGFLYPIAVAVSAVTTFTTPYMIKAAGPFADWLEQRLPPRWKAALERYGHQADQVKETSAWHKLLRSYIINLAVFMVLCLSIVFGLGPVLTALLNPGFMGISGHSLAGMATFLLVLPFIWAMSLRRIGRNAYRQLWVGKRQLRGPLVVMELVRVAAAVVVLALLVSVFFSTGWAFAALLVLMIVAVVVFRQRLHHFYLRMEDRFFRNLNQRELSMRRNDLAPWDMHLSQIRVKINSGVIGHSLQELALREQYGVNIAMIERSSGHTITAPGRNDRLFPGDNLLVIGTDSQMAQLQKALEVPRALAPNLAKEDIRMKRFRITPQSPLVGLRIHDSGLRDQAHAMVAGIERDGARIMNPEGRMQLQANDVVWLVGNGETIRSFMEQRAAIRE